VDDEAQTKISGGFRSDQGAREFALIRTMIGTAKKPDWNIIHSLMQDTQALIATLSTA
jgi:transposase